MDYKLEEGLMLAKVTPSLGSSPKLTHSTTTDNIDIHKSNLRKPYFH